MAYYRSNQPKVFMRKIERQMNAAIRNKRNWTSGNTSVQIQEDGDALVFLHGNFIARVSDRFVDLHDGGWQSVTTKSRLNAICFEFGSTPRTGIFQKNWQWFVTLFDGTTTPFFSGIQLNEAGRLA